MEQILFSPIPFEQLQQFFSDLLDEKIQQLIETQKKPAESEEYLSRKEAAQKLRISFPTLANLTREGVLKAYRIGTRVLYSASEVETALRGEKQPSKKGKNIL